MEKFTIYDIQDDPIFLEYLEDRKLQPRTIEIYTYHMKEYFNCNLFEFPFYSQVY
jgi:hypothetical protein